MEITSFILGVCAVIVLMMVVGTFVNYMSMKRLKEQLDTLDRDIYNQIDLTNQNLDKETERLIDYVDSLHKISEDTTNEIYRYIDSRMDKLETKFSAQLTSGVEVKKALDEINTLRTDFDEFVKMYRNQ